MKPSYDDVDDVLSVSSTSYYYHHRGDQPNTIEVPLSIELIEVNRMPISLIGIRLHSVIELNEFLHFF